MDDAKITNWITDNGKSFAAELIERCNANGPVQIDDVIGSGLWRERPIYSREELRAARTRVVVELIRLRHITLAQDCLGYLCLKAE